MLTESDKKWLQGETEYEHRQTAANKRAELRERVAATLLDFGDLNEHWAEDERRHTLEEIDDPEAVAAEVIEFLYTWLNGHAAYPDEMVGDDAVDNALAFRRALCSGIRNGKQHFGSAPGRVLIDSNAELFELPSVDELQRELDTNQWRQLNDYVGDAVDTDDDEVIGKKEAAKQYNTKLHLAIEQELYTRRGLTDSEIKRHDQMIASSIPQFERKDSTEE
jgi:hypothetical protein